MAEFWNQETFQLLQSPTLTNGKCQLRKRCFIYLNCCLSPEDLSLFSRCVKCSHSSEYPIRLEENSLGRIVREAFGHLLSLCSNMPQQRTCSIWDCNKEPCWIWNWIRIELKIIGLRKQQIEWLDIYPNPESHPVIRITLRSCTVFWRFRWISEYKTPAPIDENVRYFIILIPFPWIRT